MAKEIREIIAFHEQLAALSKNKPENKDAISRLQGIRNIVDAAEKRGDLLPQLPENSGVALPSVEQASQAVILDSLRASQLVEREHKALKGFFGKEIPVITPPAILFETQKIAEGEGFRLEPIYFPTVELKQGDRYKGWRVKPVQWFYDQIKAGRISPDAIRLGGFWALFDKSIRQNYDNGRQLFEDDGLAPILKAARLDGKIEVPEYLTHVPETSRFGTSPDEQDRVIFPQMAKIIRLVERVEEGSAWIRRPTESEFNFAGNLRYPHLGQANTWEWLNDEFEDDDRLVGGHSDGGGLADVHCGWSGNRSGFVAFRSLLGFSPKAR